MNVLETLREAFAAATPEGGDPSAFAAAVRPSTDPKFGDYQANGCMALAKALKKNPRELAQGVAAAVDLAPLAGPPEVAGPGFLNVRLRDDWIAATLGDLLADERLGLIPPERRKTVVIDYSSPNVAKPMHVGHVRSTVIGESLARIFAALGHKVIRDNHLGDWGSQFGMILWGWKNHRDEAAFAADPVGELARLYRLAQARIKAGETEVEEAARAETAKLHAGDPENRALWERFMPHCLAALRGVYDRLGVAFDVQLGESFYDPMLADVVEDLEAKGLAVESEGATVVFVEGTKAPFIVRKQRRRLQLRDDRPGHDQVPRGDLEPGPGPLRGRSPPGRPLQAALRRRPAVGLRPRRPGARRLRHDPGQGPQAVQDPRGGRRRARVAAGRGRRRGPQGGRREQPGPRPRAAGRVAEVVGLGAIKYADLSQNRMSDYVFDWEKMLAMNGNTGAYLQYAYARIQSIFRKGDVTPESIRDRRPAIVLSHPAERALGVQVLRLPETLELAAGELKPNILTDYLFDLANKFSTFFEECPVLKAESADRRDSRLALCDLTARTLKFGLQSLGIDVIDRM